MSRQSEVQDVADLVKGRTFAEAVAMLTEHGHTPSTRGERIIDLENDIRVQMIGSTVNPTARPYWTVFSTGEQAMPVKVAAM